MSRSTATMPSVNDARRANPSWLLGPDSMMWRINREAVLLGAGPAALLLQVAHPLIAQGVAEHSSFEQDPWRRLHGTIRTTMDLVFGDGAARAGGQATQQRPRRVRGDELPRHGPAAAALGPGHTHRDERRGVPTLGGAASAPKRSSSSGRRRAPWARGWAFRSAPARPTGPLCSVTGTRCWPTMGRSTSRPRGGGWRALIVRPPFPFVPGPLVDLAALPGLALLPPRLRAEFGISWKPTQRAPRQRAQTRPSAPGPQSCPARCARMPQAIAADRRAAAHRYNPRTP